MQALCVHGHFYQPPREDPLTSIIPEEEGAAPYKNWNEKITAECYTPNAEAGNFEKISFNIGPTLFPFIEREAPRTYQLIIHSDRKNVQRYGVGNAIAQPYNHTILPLATYQDKVTQVAWGIADFESRFSRKPEGMWLPETAVDTETLSVLVDHGIKFTILAPWQAKTDRLDPTEPYTVKLPEGREITVFFYHGGLSAGVSFESELTQNADSFAHHHLLPSFNPEKRSAEIPQFVMIATDGELYGHHKQFRDKFLAHLLNGSARSQQITPIYPGLWLKHHEPRLSIEIHDNTSWSCHHGIGRWKENCGCVPNGEWKNPLRQAMDSLRYNLDWIYEAVAMEFVDSPWQMRHDYGQVLAGQRTMENLVHAHAKVDLSYDDTETLALLLQSQYERQRMYTSCGWFFEDFARIEPRNNLAYAAQAALLAESATGEAVYATAMQFLEKVISPSTGLRADEVFRTYFHRMAIL